MTVTDTGVLKRKSDWGQIHGSSLNSISVFCTRAQSDHLEHGDARDNFDLFLYLQKLVLIGQRGVLCIWARLLILFSLQVAGCQWKLNKKIDCKDVYTVGISVKKNYESNVNCIFCNNLNVEIQLWILWFKFTFFYLNYFCLPVQFKT